MPVQIEWHPAMPVLIATYSGILTPEEYRAMLTRRTALLAEGEAQVVMVADVAELEAFAGVEKVRWRTVLADQKVMHVVLVLPSRLMAMVEQNQTADDARSHRVEFCATTEAALALAAKLLAS